MARSQLLVFSSLPLGGGLVSLYCWACATCYPIARALLPFVLIQPSVWEGGFSSIICPSYQLRYALNISSSISTVFLGSANHPTDHTTLPSERITLSAILSPSFTGGSPLPGEQSLPT
jgi:hypothetical protein